MPDESDKPRRQKDYEGLFVPAGLFIGIGVGWVFGLLVQGLFIGLGAGILAMALVRMKRG